MNADHLIQAAAASIALGIVIAVIALARAPGVPTQRLGLRGLKRHRDLEGSGLARALDPAVRLVGGWLSVLPLGSLRTRVDERLFHAGDHRGLTADEWLARSLLVGLGTAALGSSLLWLGLPPSFVVALVLAAIILHHGSLDGAIRERRRSIGRALPTAIDMIGLGVSAGQTFAAAVQDVVSRWPDDDEPIVDELRHVLRLLELGHTRAAALRSLAQRLPIAEVCDFVAAIVQSEEKGTPLRDALAVQAVVLRSRRSLRAEEAAAQADVKLVIPLVMLLLCAFLLIAGPLVLRSSESGL